MKIFINTLIRQFIVALGVIGAIASIFTIIFSNFAEIYIGTKWPYYLSGILLIAIVYATIKAYPIRNITLKLKNKLNVTIKYGDVFKQKGIIIIPVNEYFDTIVDDEIIAKGSVHGKFVIKEFGGNVEKLDNLIEQSLQSQKITYEENSDRSRGKKKKYPIGSVARIEKDENIYFLVVFTRFDENNRAKISNREYQKFILHLFEYIENFSQGKSVNLTLIGAGRSGLNFSEQKLLEFLIYFLYITDLKLENGINIILHSSIKSEINLHKLKYLFNLTK